MKRNVALQINSSAASKYLTISLGDILKCIQDGYKLKWAILSIEAIGDLGNNKSMIEFEDEINDLNNVVIMEWDELIDLSNKLDQIVDMLLIGSKDVNSLRRYSDDSQAYQNCDYTIELIDSSYWIIHSSDIKALDNIKEYLPDGSVPVLLVFYK